MSGKRALRTKPAVWPSVAGILIALTGAYMVFIANSGQDGLPASPGRSFDVPVAELTPAGPTESDAMTVEKMAAGSLFIPSVEAYAPIKSVGIKNGTLQVPGDSALVGWDKSTSPVTAVEGSTFLAGHVQARGKNGALYHLADAEPGARVYVKDEAGQVHEFMVAALEVASRKVMVPSYFETSGQRRLTIVTCTGPLIRDSNGRRHFRDAVAVIAVPISVAETADAEPSEV